MQIEAEGRERRLAEAEKTLQDTKRNLSKLQAEAATSSDRSAARVRELEAQVPAALALTSSSFEALLLKVDGSLPFTSSFCGQVSSIQSKLSSHKALTETVRVDFRAIGEIQLLLNASLLHTQVNKLNDSKKKLESENNKLASDKEKLESYTKKALHNVQEKVLEKLLAFLLPIVLLN